MQCLLCCWATRFVRTATTPLCLSSSRFLYGVWRMSLEGYPTLGEPLALSFLPSDGLCSNPLSRATDSDDRMIVEFT
jgi:hypothetical protein